MKITDLIEGLSDPLMGQDNPVIVVYDQQGKPIDRLSLSVAAEKYKFNQAQAKLQFKHQDKVRMGNITLSAPIAGQPTNEEVELDEVSQALGHKTAKARQDQASDLRQKAVDEPDMMKAFAHTKAANKAEKKAGQSYNRLIKKTNEDNTLEETYDGDDFYAAYGDLWYNDDEQLDEAEYQGRKVKLGKPMRGDVKKFKVYVKNPKGNVVKVNFGDPNMRIKKSNPARRRSFRARHNCDNPGPRHKARYWSCRKW
jgi:uncharacterized protein YneR